MVVPQSELEQRETYKNSNCRNYNPVGCSEIRRLGAHCQGLTAADQWSKAEAQIYINALKMKAAKLVIESFCWVKKPKSVHLQTDNVTALSLLVKMGGTRSAELNEISKEIWEYLIENKITHTAEYLPSSQNIQADSESRHSKDSSEWKLCPQTFARITQIMGTPSADLFAPHLCGHMFPYAFRQFSLIGKVLRKIQEDRVTAILITPTWQSQLWYPLFLKMSIKNPILLPPKKTLLMNPQESNHPLIELGSLRLAT